MSSLDSCVMESQLKVDRICKLPNSVLCHILSFLDTKLSVQTSVLSKRWKLLWTNVPRLSFHRLPVLHSLPVLNFDFNALHSAIKFEKLVTMSLYMNTCKSLDSFSLVCLQGADSFDLYHSWIRTLITTKYVSFLDLSLASSNRMSGSIHLPNCIFTSKSLKTLRLQGDLLVQTPDLVSLSRLECLSLKGVKYDCDESVRKLIEGCPVLKSLYVKRNMYDNIAVFTVSSDTLENLDILVRDFSCIQKNIHRKLDIRAPSLKYLRLCDYGSEVVSFQPLPFLNELRLFDLDESDMLDVYNPCFLNNSKWILDLVDEKLGEELKILSIGIEEIIDVVAESRKPFLTLTNLNLTSSWNWTSLLQLLGKTENLKVLKLKEHSRDVDKDPDEAPPTCFLSSLQRISVISWLTWPAAIHWNPDAMVVMLKYFLKHGEILQRLDICYIVIDSIDKYLEKHPTYHDLSGTYLGKCLGLCCGEKFERSIRDVLLDFREMSSTCEIRLVYE